MPSNGWLSEPIHGEHKGGGKGRSSVSIGKGLDIRFNRTEFLAVEFQPNFRSSVASR